MRSARSSRLARAGLVLSSLLLGFLSAEAAMRLVSRGTVDDRVLFTTSTYFQDSKGVPRLTPHRPHRWVLLASGRAEFDVSFTTNNLGFIDHRDYVLDPNSWAIAIAGDSFTAGVEANRPWLPVLRDEARLNAPKVEIYNFGTGAAGVRQFFQILDSAADQLSFDAVTILAITEDFYRSPWIPRQEGGRLHLCVVTESASDCLRRRPVAFMISGEESADELARGLTDTPSPQPVSWRAQLRRSLFLVALKRTWDQHSSFRRAVFADNVEALAEITKRFPERQIDFVHLPEKIEVQNGRYREALRERVEAAGMRYHDALASCKWSEDLFYENDSHPNARGYQAVSDCVAHLVLSKFFAAAGSTPTSSAVR